MTLGIILGVALGLVTGFIPGFNVGLLFLAAYSWGHSNNDSTTLLFYLFLVGALVNGLVSNITLLTPIAAADDPVLIGPLQKSIKYGKGVTAIAHAYFSYAAGLALVLLMGLILIFTHDTVWLKSSLEYIPLSIFLALGLWLLFILSSKDKTLTIIVLILASLAGLIVINKFPSNSMFTLATALFGTGYGLTLEPQQLPKQKFNLPNQRLGQVKFFVTGLIGGWLIGLPTSALCSILKTKKQDPSFTIANTALAQGASAGMSTILVLTNSGARDTASTYIDYLNLLISDAQAIAIIVICLLITAAVGFLFFPLTKSYLKLVVAIPPNLIKLFIIGLNTGTLIHAVSFYTIPLVALGIAISKLIHQGKLNSSLSLASLSLIPLISLY